MMGVIYNIKDSIVEKKTMKIFYQYCTSDELYSVPIIISMKIFITFVS